MSAAAVAQPQGQAFSPLTMFECTISSATMLIDGMAVRDLLVAFRIVAQLHGHLLEVLDPGVQRLSDVAEEHAKCTAASFVRNSTPTAAPGTSKPEPTDSFSFKPEASNSDDDCVVMEADLMFDASTAQLAPGPLASAPRDINDAGELSNDWKAILRKAYRTLKEETGTDVFDFSLPYSAGYNSKAAVRVIDKALQLSARRPADLAAWRKIGNRYLHNYFAWTLKPSAKRQYKQARLLHSVDRFKNLAAKIGRRQRGYEAIKHSLSDSERTRFESVVLAREYTSSDEEEPGAGEDAESPMRVRSLPWESDELRSMKRQLDDVFLQRVADQAQLAEAMRLQRDVGLMSDRPPPADDNYWARQPGHQSAPL